jgi:uncharacterized protein YndB with AHSA1/START domain
MAETRTLRIERIFDAPVAKVWAAWTEPEQVARWWGPKDFTSHDNKVDLKVGGTYVFSMQGPAGTEWDKPMYSGGVYKEIVPMKKLVVTDNFMDKDGTYIGFMDDDLGRVHDAYPTATWKRLAAVKQRYDPDNLFRLNHNIVPNKVIK